LRHYEHLTHDPLETPMKRKFVLVSIVGTLVVATALTGRAATAVSPVPANNIPKVQLNWLASLSLNPTSVVVGGDVIGTVTLLRPAIENMKLSLVVPGAEPNEMGVQVAPNAVAPMALTVPVGASSATFKITTGAKQGVSLPKSYTITASYGTESKTASFTVVSLQKITQPH
jgi:hypothetical protein